MLRQEGRPSPKPPWGTNTRGHPQPSHEVPSLSTKFAFRQQQNAAVRAFNIGCCKGLPDGKTLAASAVCILQDLWLRLKRLPLEPPDVDLLLAWAGRCSELLILERNGMYGVLEYDLWWFFAQSFQRIDGFSGRQPRPPCPLPTDPTEGSRRQRAERRTIEQSRALESASPKPAPPLHCVRHPLFSQSVFRSPSISHTKQFAEGLNEARFIGVSCYKHVGANQRRDCPCRSEAPWLGSLIPSHRQHFF